MAPDLCEGQGFDAIALLRGELFIFKGEYVWRLTEKYRIQAGYPVRFNEIFSKLSAHVNHIDAIYERPTDGAIILFNGNQYWAFDGNNFIDDSPRPISDYGFDENVTKIDAAMVWSKNGRTYLFAGKQFIRYDELTKRIDNDNYPANISDKWRGIPDNIDAATSVANGNFECEIMNFVEAFHFISIIICRQEKRIFLRETCIGCTTIIGFDQNVDILDGRQQFGWDVRFNCVNGSSGICVAESEFSIQTIDNDK